MDKMFFKDFGLEVNIKKAPKPVGLPLYMTSGRNFYKASLCGCFFVLVEVERNDRFGSIALKKQLNKYRDAFESEVAYSFGKLTKPQRDSLIKNNIPFVAGHDQVFMPFIGVILRNNLKKEEPADIKKMSPAAQELFLYLLYSGNKRTIKKEAADYLGVTRMTITRASGQLKAMGLIKEENAGRERIMLPLEHGKAYFEKAKPYLINPVMRELYVDQKIVGSDFLDAGETALSRVSLLNPPKIRAAAIFKSNIDRESLEEIDIRWDDRQAVKLQLWKYDPALFAKDGNIDPVSLAMSLKDSADERAAGELEEYLEDYKW